MSERIDQIRAILNETPEADRDSSELALTEVFAEYDKLQTEITQRIERQQTTEAELAKQSDAVATLTENLRLANATIEKHITGIGKAEQFTITPADAIKVLNEALTLDQKTITSIMMNRFLCTKELSDHPTIQSDSVGPTVGPLGIINGLFGVDENTCGPIAAVFDQGTGLITKFKPFKTPQEAA